MPGYLRRRAEGLWGRIWPLTGKRIAVLALILVFTMILAFEVQATETFTVEVVIIGEEKFVGFNPTTERLDFGDMSRGTGQTRSITLENAGVIPTRIYIMVLGDVRDFIQIDDAFFVMDPGEVTQVDLTMIVPSSASIKRYSGRLLVIRSPWSPWP